MTRKLASILHACQTVTPLASLINEVEHVQIRGVMTVHKLSAGDGYAYYTSEVASADELRAEGRELGDYYTVEGMPPGQWVAHSETLLGVSGEVTEAQMAALFGEGIRPDADRILAAGGTEADVALGQKYHRYASADTELTRRLEEEIARHERTTGAAPVVRSCRAISSSRRRVSSVSALA